MMKLKYKYDVKLISEMRKINGRWDNVEKCWIFNPLFYKFLSSQFRNKELDDEYINYTSNIENKIKSISVTREELYTNNLKLTDYQVKGVRYLLEIKNVILNMGLGSGKTLTSLYGANELIKNKPDAKILILCPASMKRLVWEKEINKFFPNMTYVVVEGSKQERKNMYAKGKVLIVSMETARTMFDREILKNVVWDAVIIDEASKLIKNHTTLSNKMVSSLTSIHRWALTGYVVENSITDVFGIMKFIDKNLFTNFDTFKDWFCTTELIQNHWNKGYIEVITGSKNEKLLKEILQKYVYRVGREVIDKELPEKTEQNIFVDMEKEQLNSYNKIVDSVGSNNVFEVLTYLREVVDFPCMIGEAGEGSKSNELENILNELQGGRTIIFTQFVKCAEILYSKLKDKFKTFYIIGDTSMIDREIILKDFEKTNNSLLICSDVLSYGFNMQFACNIINFDMPFNPVKLDNRIARVYRKGQMNKVTVVNMITKNSIEEKIWDIIINKKELHEKLTSVSMGMPNWDMINYLLGKSK